jgi:hypothetical protein
MRKCAKILSYMRRPLVIYDSATAPVCISYYMRNFFFFTSAQFGSTTMIMPKWGEIKYSEPLAGLWSTIALRRVRTNANNVMGHGHLHLQRGQGHQINFRSKIFSRQVLCPVIPPSPRPHPYNGWVTDPQLFNIPNAKLREAGFNLQ